jgi:hypothetical protein
MCDTKTLEEGYSIPSTISYDNVNLYESAPKTCIRFEGSFALLKRRSNNIQLQLTFFKNQFLPDGYFNYVFSADGTLHAAPLENEFEVGSKHKHIALESNIKRVIAAGEMLKSGNLIQFNLSSGTFMKEFMVTTLKGQCNNELIQKTIQLFKQYYPSFRIEFVTRSFITLKDIPLTREHVLKYVKAGYEVRLYSSKKACVDEIGPFTLFQSAAKRKTRRLHRRKTLKRK